jgi:hypothetical protein
MHDIIRVSTECAIEIEKLSRQQTIHHLTIQVMSLQSLISQLDPEHLYVYATEYGGFVKTKKREDTDG